MSAPLELSQEIRESIGDYVTQNLRAWFDQSFAVGYAQRDIDLRERTVRVEEELKNQSDLIRTGFERVDARFEDVNKRFAEQRSDFLARFERIDERMAEQREEINRRFSEQRNEFNSRFDAADRHNNRLMTVLTVMLGLTGIAVTVTNLIA
jgi:hypothetical protein